MKESRCSKCGRKMISTTPDKAYCMKCDILIHIPSGVAYTGDPEEDKFIGLPGVLFGEPRNDFAATLGPDALLLTWKDGNESRMEKVPYQTIVGLDVGERRQSEIDSLESAVGAALGAGLAFGALSAIEQAMTRVKTPKVKTEPKQYEIWVPDAVAWAERIKKQQGISKDPASETTSACVGQDKVGSAYSSGEEGELSIGHAT